MPDGSGSSFLRRSRALADQAQQRRHAARGENGALHRAVTVRQVGERQSCFLARLHDLTLLRLLLLRRVGTRGTRGVGDGLPALLRRAPLVRHALLVGHGVLGTMLLLLLDLLGERGLLSGTCLDHGGDRHALHIQERVGLAVQHLDAVLGADNGRDQVPHAPCETLIWDGPEHHDQPVDAPAREDELPTSRARLRAARRLHGCLHGLDAAVVGALGFVTRQLRQRTRRHLRRTCHVAAEQMHERLDRALRAKGDGVAMRGH